MFRRICLERYADQRCNDLQRECDQLRGGLDRVAHGLHMEVSERHRLLDEEIDRRIVSLRSQHDMDISGLKDLLGQYQVSLDKRLEELIRSLRDQDGQQEGRLRKLESESAGVSASETTVAAQKQERHASTALALAAVTAALYVISVTVAIIIATRH